MATIAALSKPKHSRHLSHLIWFLHRGGLSSGTGVMLVSCMLRLCILGLIPPVAEKTRGTNDPCSTS